MIALQHYNELQPVSAIEIDWAVKDIQGILKDRIEWLTHPYGRVYRIDKQGLDKRQVLPEVYIGNTDGKYSLIPVTPDNDKKAISFFVVGKERQLTKDIGQNYLSWDVGIVFWVNLEMINATLSLNEDFTQRLIKEVREVLTKYTLGSGYRIELNTVEREYSEIFKEFTLQDRRYIIMPFSSFRFNMTVTLKEGCGFEDITINNL